MPTTQDFMAHTLNNGFPWELERQDVSGFTYWVTLGGTEKGNSPTVSQKQLSFTNAFQLWWNLYGITGTFRAINTTDGTNTVTAVDDDGTEPYERVCGKAYAIGDSVTNGGNFLDTVNNIGGPPSGLPTAIVRMYNGSTTDEANFLGYGFKDDGFSLESAAIGLFASSDYNGTGADFDTDVTLTLSSFNSGFVAEATTGYTSIDGFYFVASARARSTGTCAGTPTSTTSISLTADNISITAEGKEDGVSVAKSEISVTGLQFYTY